ncbi:MAG TPA: phosphoglucosamine mutase [Thermoanaerobaculia bacterium]|jgi:phosphoglucosamine mutase|nr:phosphoglucosamine mutase [Thermoanaerobaculia bacterium]
MRELFGTDGIRGKAHQYPLDALTMTRLGVALARRLTGTRRVLFGRDTRESGPEIAGALARGIEEGGGRAEIVGVIPTPGIAYLCRVTDAEAAISISASHNPWQDNGVKIFGHDGMKIPDAIEEELEADLKRVEVEDKTVFELDGEMPQLIERYEEFLVKPNALRGKRVVLDAGFGAAYRIAPEAFRRAGADVIVMNDTPNGRNINEQSGALHPQGLAKRVVAEGADFGVAFDGDADRAIFADDAGKIRDGDEIIYLWSQYLKREEKLTGDRVVTTVMSNFGFEAQLQRDGIELLRAQVGDKYVLELMLAHDAVIGGEQSGHIIDRTVHTTGDGIHTALVFGEILAQSHARFSELKTFEPMPQLLLNEKVGSKPALDSLPKYQQALAEAHEQLGGRGRILVRYSGTENLVRVMVEGDDESRIRKIAEHLRDVLRTEIG